MQICLIEGYASGSHLYFAKKLKEEFKREYSWELTIVATPGRHWRTRLQKGHAALVEILKEKLAQKEMATPDLFIVTSLTDTAAFRGLLPRELSKVPIIQFMHENQMSYPLNPKNSAYKLADVLQRNIIPGYHLNQLLGSDIMVFNSEFHREDFFMQLDGFLSDHGEKELKKKVSTLKEKTLVIPIGIPTPNQDLPNFFERPKRLLWNHRWEYDKNPDGFSSLVEVLLKENNDWQLSLLGENKSGKSPISFEELKRDFGNQIVHYGMIENRDEYYQVISKSRLLPVTSHHDFLGLATIEAMIYGVVPLLPKRLVYPELVPQELHHKLLYGEIETKTDNEDFIQKCKTLMVQGLDNQEESLLKEHLSRYKWSSIMPQWRDLIGSLENIHC